MIWLMILFLLEI